MAAAREAGIREAPGLAGQAAGEPDGGEEQAAWTEPA